MANSGKELTSLDFDTIKYNLKQYLKSQAVFTDYDFEGSNINVLLDVLAYNTQLNAFYLNMLGSEMFLDSALLRDSAVSHAKELNYVPRSFRSAQALVNVTLRDTTDNPSVLLPRGTSFTGRNAEKSFTFVLGGDVIAESDPDNDNIFLANNVIIYEGDYTYDSYTVNDSDSVRYIVTNKTIDTNSVSVTAIEDNGETSLLYNKADNLFGLGATSQVFFLQAAENDTYEIVFGDGVIGRKPKDRSIILIQYRKCNGELPNGINQFFADDSIGSSTVTNVQTVSSASGGSIPESIQSIKFNAPRAFTTQERVVTAEDYKTLLLQNFSDINDVSAYGGEEAVPPRFGKVIVAVDLKNTDTLPPTRAQEYNIFIKKRSPLSIDPIFVTPQYTYIDINTVVKYDINVSSLSSETIKNLVLSSIQNYNLTQLNGFRKTMRYSKFVSDIDNSDNSIISNDTEIRAMKRFEPDPTQTLNYTIDFGIKLDDDITILPPIRKAGEKSVVTSSTFGYSGNQVVLEDDGEGTMRLMIASGSTYELYKTVGTIDYEKGVISLNAFRPSSLNGRYIKVYARTFESDIESMKNTILSVANEDIKIKIEQERL
jgi:hypothetical protein